MQTRLWPRLALLCSLIGCGHSFAADNCRQGSIKQQNDCARQALQHEEQLLQQNLHQLQQQLAPDAAQKLAQEQQTWLQQRDRECRAAGEGKYAGPMSHYLKTVCLAGMSKRRNDDFEARLGGEVADDSKIVWLHDQQQQAAFNCQGQISAKIGLQPAYTPQNIEFYAKLQLDQHSINFPIGGSRDDALCNKNLKLELVRNHRPCPAIKLSDGQCKPLLIYWDEKQQNFVWLRQ